MTKNSSSFGPIARLSSGWAATSSTSVMWLMVLRGRLPVIRRRTDRNLGVTRGAPRPAPGSARTPGRRPPRRGRDDDRDAADGGRRARARWPPRPGRARGRPAGAAGHDDDEDALHPAAHLVGGHGLQHRERYTELTRSPAPATASASTASHSEPVSPNSATPRPHTQIATVTATPCRRIRCSQPENRPATTMPIGIAANSRPRAMPPPSGSPNTVCDDLREHHPRHPEPHRDDIDEERHQQHLVHGRVAEPGDDLAESRPAGGAGRLRRHRRQPPGGPEGGEQRDGVEQVERRQPDRPGSARRRAAARRWHRPGRTVMFSALAAGSSSAGSSRGSTALRVGWLTARNAVCTANSTRTIQTPPTRWPR